MWPSPVSALLLVLLIIGLVISPRAGHLRTLSPLSSPLSEPEDQMSPMPDLRTVASVQALFESRQYIADRALALTVKLAGELQKPILLEGEAGVGKTEVAKVLASVHIRIAEHDAEARAKLETSIFDDQFLLNRPLLAAIRHPGPRPAVLLIDEIDRADEEFEAFLLEILSDYQITVPEIGTFKAALPPYVILTSNRTRELNDALKRRCLYLWVDFPAADKEREIIRRRLPALDDALANAVANVMQALRRIDFYKRPGIAETLDWSRALLGLEVRSITPELLLETAGVILKYRDDIERLRALDLDAVLAGETPPAASSRQVY
jgi:MoxR-like ATPase